MLAAGLTTARYVRYVYEGADIALLRDRVT